MTLRVILKMIKKPVFFIEDSFGRVIMRGLIFQDQCVILWKS